MPMARSTPTGTGGGKMTARSASASMGAPLRGDGLWTELHEPCQSAWGVLPRMRR